MEDHQEQPANQEQDAPGPALLESLEHYIRSRGIAPHAGDENYVDPERERQINDESQYQQDVHRIIFGSDGGESKSDETVEKERFLETLKGRTIGIKADGGVTLSGTSLYVLASMCDTVCAFARFEKEKTVLELNLTQFHEAAIREFLSVVEAERAVEDLSPDLIVECCRIAHFVQCIPVVDDIVAILQESIDSHNCVSLCHLADTLEIPSLFERSVSHMTGKLVKIEEHENWNDFPKSIQHRVVAMRNAVQSSILGRGQKASVFFSSSEEFLAIFSDSVREQKERLREAKQRQEDVIRERTERGGRHRDPMGGSVRDAAIKIDRQERRIETLDIFYKEQKLIFSGQGKGPFRLGFS